MSTLFQGEVTSDRARLTRALSAETDISTLHKNHPTDTLGGIRLTSLPSSLHTWRKQTCQLCAKTGSTHPAETDIVNFVPSGQINGIINHSRHIRWKQTLSTLFQLEVTRGRELRNHFFNNFFLKIAVFRCGSGSDSGHQLRNLNFSIHSF